MRRGLAGCGLCAWCLPRRALGTFGGGGDDGVAPRLRELRGLGDAAVARRVLHAALLGHVGGLPLH